MLLSNLLKETRKFGNATTWQHHDLYEMSSNTNKARYKKFGTLFTNVEIQLWWTIQICIAKRWNLFQRMIKQQWRMMLPYGISNKVWFENRWLSSWFKKVCLTKLIQENPQPCYCQVSCSIRRRDYINMRRISKIKMILGFDKLETCINLTRNVWRLHMVHQIRIFVLPFIG